MFSIEFKILLISVKVFHSFAPSYISDLLVITICTRGLLPVPGAQLKTQRDKAFAGSETTCLDKIKSVTSLKSSFKKYFDEKAFPSP